MKAVIASLLIAATVLASPAFARSGSRTAPQNQGNAVYQGQSGVYQGGAIIRQHGIDPAPPAFGGRFTPEQQRIIDAISRNGRNSSP